MALNLARNSRVYASTVLTGFDATNTWEILVQDGFSFSQGIGTQDITVNEAGATPTRGSQTFNTQLDPAEWSFSAYVRSYLDPDGATQAVEGVLWAALASNESPVTDATTAGMGSTSTNSVAAKSTTHFEAAFDTSDAHELVKLNLFFQVDGIWYIIKDCQVNQAEIDFAIDNIAMITWSGQGTQLLEIDSAAVSTDAPSGVGEPISTAYASRSIGGDYLMVPPTATYIKNKLSTLSLISVGGASQNDNTVSYSINITGGNLTINNNITYLTPETLSVVDKPIGSFTGSRQVSGSLTCYLNSGATGSAKLLANLSANQNTTNRYNLSLNIGGPTGPALVLEMPTTQLSVPVIDVQDVLGVNIDFAAQGSTGLDSTDELVAKYYYNRP